jgi:hypothetical protein
MSGTWLIVLMAVAVMAVVMYLLALLSGWRRLARAYPWSDREVPANHEAFSPVLCLLNNTGQSAWTRVVIHDVGLLFLSRGLLRLWHPAFCIPWAQGSESHFTRRVVCLL